MARIAWIDTAKAIGIFLVILAHHRINPAIVIWIFSFHMPLFFFISGHVFDPSRHPDFASFFKKKLDTLIWPYLYFALFSYLIWLLIVRKLSIHGQCLTINPFLPIINIFYGIKINSWVTPLDTVLWFLPCLFITEMIIWNIVKSFDRRFIIFVLMAIAGFGISINMLEFPKFPWSIDVALMASIFYGVGYLSKEMVAKWMDHKNFIFSLFLFLATSIWLSAMNGKIDMNDNQYGNIFLFYISSFAGIFFILGLSKVIKSEHMANYLGQNTLIIMGMNGISYFLLRAIIFMFKGSLPVTSCLPFYKGLSYTILQIIFILPVIFIINNYMPFIIGRQIKK